MSITKSTDWLCARAGDEVMMMSASHGTYIGLNAMAARIWDLLETIGDFEPLCARLVEEFDVGEAQCRAEVEAFLAELERHKAIMRTSVAAG